MTDVIEPAASGRAKCRWCGEKIAKGALRFGERRPNPFGDGEATYWFHLSCAAEKRGDALGTALEAYDGEVPDRAALEEIVADARRNPKLAQVRRAERAPTGRARCQQCREKIEKASVRVAVEREDEDFPSAAQVSFVHAACAAEHLGAEGLLAKLRRTSAELDDEGVAELERILGD